MIQKIKITNFYGIKDFFIDLTVKNQSQSHGQEEQLIANEKNFFSLTPTFLAKNASGKTSFLKALSFASEFMNRKSFINSILGLKMKEFRLLFFHMDKEMLAPDINEFKQIDVNEKLVRMLFNWVSFLGSEKSTIEITLSKKRIFKLEISRDSFEVTLNNEIIDVFKILNIIRVLEFLEKPRSQVQKQWKKILNNFFDKYKVFEQFEDTNCEYLHKFPSPFLQIEEPLKNETDLHIKNLVKSFGFQPLKTLLLKLDKNVKGLIFDVANDKVEVFVKETNQELPISSKSLSSGTRKILAILSDSIKLFKEGGIMLVDEIENGLHLSLIKLIISFYASPGINKKRAQLFLTTHNSLLIERRIIEIYNVYMEEKNNFVNINEIINNFSHKRSEDKIKVIKSKNYYNDLFWEKQNQSIRSTLSYFAIEKIVDTFLESEKWQARKK